MQIEARKAIYASNDVVRYPQQVVVRRLHFFCHLLSV